MKDAIISNQEWSLYLTHAGVLQGDPEYPEHVKETFDILDMWRMLRNSWNKLEDDAKAEVLEKLGKDVVPEFEGFDANNDPHYGVARHLVQIERYTELQDYPLNSHSMVQLQIYRRYLTAYREQETGLHGILSKDQLVQVFQR